MPFGGSTKAEKCRGAKGESSWAESQCPCPGAARGKGREETSTDMHLLHPYGEKRR